MTAALAEGLPAVVTELRVKEINHGVVDVVDDAIDGADAVVRTPGWLGRLDWLACGPRWRPHIVQGILYLFP